MCMKNLESSMPISRGYSVLRMRSFELNPDSLGVRVGLSDCVACCIC